ncbi:unnamed protein product [Pipistrellus nathusii]|uniref:Uncharacterized protein n=1 Tax=Pipistrellus nathusii TaxID=59473 RepID=A0ABN9Z1E3_PIPNA
MFPGTEKPQDTGRSGSLLSPISLSYGSDLQSPIGSGLAERKCGLQSLPQHCKAKNRRVGLELGDNSLIAGTNTVYRVQKCMAASPPPNLTDSVLCLVYVCRISVRHGYEKHRRD